MKRATRPPLAPSRPTVSLRDAWVVRMESALGEIEALAWSLQQALDKLSDDPKAEGAALVLADRIAATVAEGLRDPEAPHATA